MTPQLTETEAVVLNCIDHGESDVIITLFCQNTGRISAIAKGARRSKKRFVNKLELFSFLHVCYQQKADKSLAFLVEADLHTSFFNIRLHPDLYAVASVIREFLLIAMKEGDVDNKTFSLCLWALHNLDQKEQPTTVLTLFLIRFFAYIGYRPNFEMCSQCNISFSTSQKYHFNTASGGIICTNCTTGRQPRPLSHGTIKILSAAQNLPLEKLHRLKISGTVLEEALRLLHNYGRQLFQRDIASWKILTQLIHTPGSNRKR